MLTRQ
jgi:hypothetical protein